VRMLGVLFVGIAVVTGTPVGAEAETAIKIAQAQRPANLVKYSLRYWPQNTLRKDQTVSSDTPFGTLSCRGVHKQAGGRECSLSPK
jgi:hypothetical protein